MKKIWIERTEMEMWRGLTRGLESIPWAHILLLDKGMSPGVSQLQWCVQIGNLIVDSNVGVCEWWINKKYARN